jgi:hypothetical protein
MSPAERGEASEQLVRNILGLAQSGNGRDRGIASSYSVRVDGDDAERERSGFLVDNCRSYAAVLSSSSTDSVIITSGSSQSLSGLQIRRAFR